MNIKENKVLKYLIGGCIIFMIILSTASVKDVYAYDPRGKLTMSLSTYDLYLQWNETASVSYFLSKEASIYWGIDNTHIATGIYRAKSHHFTITGRSVGVTKIKIRAVYSQNDYATAECRIHVLPISSNKISVSVSQSEYNYDGYSHRPSVQAFIDNRTIGSGNYNVIYPSDTVSAGWKTITIVFKGNYTGRKYIQYRIKGIPYSQVSVSLSRYSYTYDGNLHRPTVTVSAKGWRLTQGTSYTLSWTGNGIDAGINSVTVNLKGNYEGWIRYNYTINKANIAYADIRHIEKSTFTYTGGDQYPEFRVKFGSKTLGYKDFTYSFPRDSVTAGEKIIRIEGRGNYCGYKNSYYTITKRNISSGKIELNKDEYIYTGGDIKPGIKSVKVNGSPIYDYNVKYENNKYPGKARMILTGKNNNTGTIIKTFNIVKRNISGGDIVLDKQSYTYTGGQIKPKVVAVMMPNHTTHVYDYKVDYGTNKYCGKNKGWVKITGQGSNTGSITKYFTIDKRDISNAKITLEKSTYIYTGKNIEPKVTLVTVNGSPIYDYNVSYANNRAIGTATVTVTGYNNNAGTAKTTFKIEKERKYAIVENYTGKETGYTKTVTVGNKKYKVYNQGSFGQNIARGGCSITSEAIILSGYGINKTPSETSKTRGVTLTIDQTAQNLTDEAVSARSVICKANEEASTTVKNQAIKDITNNLNSDKPVIILVRPADEGSENHRKKYTSEAHYMALLGYSSNGNPLIADPNGGKTWDEDSIETLVNEYIYDKDSSNLEQGYILINK